MLARLSRLARLVDLPPETLLQPLNCQLLLLLLLIDFTANWILRLVLSFLLLVFHFLFSIKNHQ
jgi:hypothetical protein